MRMFGKRGLCHEDILEELFDQSILSVVEGGPKESSEIGSSGNIQGAKWRVSRVLSGEGVCDIFLQGIKFPL